jgi:hypothetical protein
MINIKYVFMVFSIVDSKSFNLLDCVSNITKINENKTIWKAV